MHLNFRILQLSVFLPLVALDIYSVSWQTYHFVLLSVPSFYYDVPGGFGLLNLIDLSVIPCSSRPYHIGAKFERPLHPDRLFLTMISHLIWSRYCVILVLISLVVLMYLIAFVSVYFQMVNHDLDLIWSLLSLFSGGYWWSYRTPYVRADLVCEAALTDVLWFRVRQFQPPMFIVSFLL